MARIESTDEGIVLLKKKLLKDDWLVVIESKEHGKLSLIVKGARTITSRRSSLIQTGNLITFAFSSVHHSFYLKHVSLISHFLDLKNDEQKLKYLYQFLFLFSSLIPDNQPDIHLYALCKSQIIHIAQSNEIRDQFVLEQINRLLTQLGYGTKNSLEDCYAFIEETIGKKIPQGVL